MKHITQSSALTASVDADRVAPANVLVRAQSGGGKCLIFA